MTNPPDIRSAAVADIIDAAHHGRRLRGWQVFSVVILLGLLGWWWLAAGHEEDRVSYQTDVLTRGTLVVQVSATGNLQPTNQVDVGSELSGTMQSVAVDVNDQVTRGQVLAQLDTARLEDTVIKSRAALLVAQARVQQGLATAAEEQANLNACCWSSTCLPVRCRQRLKWPGPRPAWPVPRPMLPAPRQL